MENQPINTIIFDIFSYCPALVALWGKHITDERGFLKPVEQIGGIGFSVEVSYNPIHPDTSFTDCEAPIRQGSANHPGAPFVEFIETIPTSSGLADRFNVRCGGCILKRGGFSTTTRY